MRWLFLLLISVSAAGAAYFAWPAVVALRKAPAAPDSTAMPPDDEDALRIFAGGIVEGSRREIALRFEIAGRLKELKVRAGERVEQGDVLAELDADLWEQKFAEAGTMLKLARAERDKLLHETGDEAREAARARLRTAESQARDLEAQLVRAKQAARQDAAAAKDVEELKGRLERVGARLVALRARSEELEAPVRRDDLTIADSKVALAEGALRRERILLEKTLLRAPSDGVVLRVLGEPGELVGPHDAGEVLSLVDRSRTRVRAFVEELDALDVRPGQRALVSAEARPEVRYEGVVQSCSPLVAPKSQRHQKPGEFVDIRVRELLIELSGGDELLIGLPVDVLIIPSRDRSPASRAEVAQGSPPGPPESPR